MLKEFITHLLTPAPRYVKKMGYLHELIAISERHKRCHKSWQPHLDRCKEFIRKAITHCHRRKKAVILGAGLLLDIPLKELAGGFEEVVLVDIVHLSKTRREAGKYRNVSLLNADITGIAEAIYSKRQLATIDIKGALPGCDTETDLVVSANILSQLALCPVGFLTEKCHVTERTAQNWGKNLIEAHLIRLSKLECTVCLITDNKLSFVDKSGNRYAVQDTLYGIIPQKLLHNIHHEETWQWEIAPLGEISEDCRMTLEVMGLITQKRTGISFGHGKSCLKNGICFA